MSFTRTLIRPSLLSVRAITQATRTTMASRSQSSLIRQSSALPEFQQLIKEPKLTVVDFFAVWCGPCNAIAPVLEKFSQEYTDVQFLKVDVDEAEDIALEYGITAMPTFVLFKEGEAVGKIIGANPAGVKKAIEEYK